MSKSSTNLQKVNSTSYADVAGLSSGLDRLPGEETPVFLARLYRAANSGRGRGYEGALDELSLHLGLNTVPGIRITADDPTAVISCRLGRIALTDARGTSIVSGVDIEADSYWKWKALSDVTTAIDSIPGWHATLLTNDGPALQIARQDNVLTVIAEEVSGQFTQLEHGNILGDSVRFNQTLTGGFGLSADGALRLAAQPPDGTTISYQYRVLPYEVVCCPIGIFSLADPATAVAGVGANNVIAYQLREILQAVMQADPSYWAR